MIGDNRDYAERRLAHLLDGRALRDLATSQRALIGARMANAERKDNFRNLAPDKITAARAAALVGVAVSTVRVAKTLLRRASKEEIARIDRGVASISAIRQGFDGIALRERGRNPQRVEQMRLNAQVWRRLKEGLDALSSLPATRDVAVIARYADRTELINRKLLTVYTWLGEFIDVWTEPDKR